MTGLTLSISQKDLFKSRYFSVPGKPFVIRSGKRVLPVYESFKPMAYYDIDMNAKVTTIDWKFFGENAYVLPPGIWNNLQQKRRCKAVFVPLETPRPAEYNNGNLIGFVAASVDIQELSIASGQPLPKKPKRKNKKSQNLGYTPGQPMNTAPAQTITTTNSAGATITFVQAVPTHINTTKRKSDGYVVYSTDVVNKPLKAAIDYHSSSKPGLRYTVNVYKDSSVSCNCMAWTRRTPRSCKHIMDDRTITLIKK